MISPITNLHDYSVLVSGASGFLGRHFVAHLLEQGASVVGVFRSLDGFDLVKDSSFFGIAGDLSLRSDVNKAFDCLKENQRKIMAVIHLCAENHGKTCELYPYDAFKTNFDITLELLEASRINKVNRFLFPSTAYVYGNSHKGLINENGILAPQSVYASSKLAAETLIQSFGKKCEFSADIFRLSNVYGPGSHNDNVVNVAIESVINCGEVRLKDLTPVRDFIYYSDVVNGFIYALKNAIQPGIRIFNLSTGIPTSIKELGLAISKAVNQNINVIQTTQENSNSELVLNPEYFCQSTGWRAKISLEQGLIDQLRQKKGE